MESVPENLGSVKPGLLGNIGRLSKACTHPAVIWCVGVNCVYDRAPTAIRVFNRVQLLSALLTSIANEFGEVRSERMQKVLDFFSKKINPHFSNAAFNGINACVGLGQWFGVIGGDITPKAAREKVFYGFLALACYSAMGIQNSPGMKSWIDRQRKSLRLLATPGLWLTPQIPIFYGPLLAKLSEKVGSLPSPVGHLPITDIVLWSTVAALAYGIVRNAGEEKILGQEWRNADTLGGRHCHNGAGRLIGRGF